MKALKCLTEWNTSPKEVSCNQVFRNVVGLPTRKKFGSFDDYLKNIRFMYSYKGKVINDAFMDRKVRSVCQKEDCDDEKQLSDLQRVKMTETTSNDSKSLKQDIKEEKTTKFESNGNIKNDKTNITKMNEKPDENKETAMVIGKFEGNENIESTTKAMRKLKGYEDINKDEYVEVDEGVCIKLLRQKLNWFEANERCQEDEAWVVEPEYEKLYSILRDFTSRFK